MKNSTLTIGSYYYDNSINAVFQYLGKDKYEDYFQYRFRTTTDGFINMSKRELSSLSLITSIN